MTWLDRARALFPYHNSRVRTLVRERALSAADFPDDYFEDAPGRDARVTSNDALSIPGVWKAMREIASDVAGLETVVLDENDEEREHPALQLLTEGNAIQDGYGVRQTQMFHFALYNNSYSEIELTTGGEPLALYPIQPGRIVRVFTVMQNGVPSKRFEISRQSGRNVILDERQVLHFYDLSDDGLVGVDPVRNFGRVLNLVIQAQRYGSRFFKTGRPLTVLSVMPDPMGASVAPDMPAITKAFKDATAGEQAQGVVAVKNMTVTPVGTQPDESQFLETQKWGLNEIGRIWDMPPTKLGDTSASTYDNVQQYNVAFVREVLATLVERRDSAFTRAFLAGTGLRFHTSIDPLIEGTDEEKFRLLLEEVELGVMTKNEYRLERGRDPLPELENDNDAGNDFAANQANPFLAMAALAGANGNGNGSGSNGDTPSQVP